MREPESRRGVPLRAGIGIATVAATVVAGIALASPASAAGGPYSITENLSSASVQALINDTVSGLVRTSTGAGENGDTVTLSLSQTSATDPVFTVGGTALVESSSGSGASTVWTATTTTTTATVNSVDGSYSFAVNSAAAGTVTAQVSAGAGITTSKTFTVTGGKSGNDSVASLNVTPATNATYYVTDTAPTFSVTPNDSSGSGVSNATVNYSVSGVDSDNNSCGPLAAGAIRTAQSYAITCAPHIGGTAGTDTVTFWANQSTGGSLGLDSGEPSAIRSVSFVAAPAIHATTITPSPSAIEAGKSATVNYTLTATDTSGAAVAGAKVALDVTIGGTTTRYNATTDASGQAKFAVPVTAAQAVTGNNPITAVAFESGTTTIGDGIHLAAAGDVTIAAAQQAITAPADLSVTNGSTISIPVTLADQFGNAPSGAVTVTYTVTAGRNLGKTGTVSVTGGKGTISYTDTGSVGTSDTVHLTAPSTTEAWTTVHYVTSIAPANITFTGPGSSSRTVSKTANQQVTAAVTNAAGQPLAGVSVTLKVDKGFVGGTSTADSTAGKSYVATTDSSGVATAYIGSVQAGVQTVSATSGSATAVDSTTVTYYPDTAIKVTLTGPSSPVKAGSSVTFTAKVVDQFGNGVSFDDVSFSATDPSTLPGGVSPVSTWTGPNGTASLTIKAGAAAGMITVVADVTGPNNTATAAYTIAKPPAKKVETPKLSGKSYRAGTAKVNVSTSPSISHGTVKIYHWTGKKWAKMATLTTNSSGKAGVVLKGLKKGGLAHFKAIATSKAYIEHYSSVLRVPVKK